MNGKEQENNIPIEDKEKVFKKRTVEGRDIYFTNTFYQELCVSKVPFDIEFVSEENMIISPEAAMLSNDDWIAKNLVGKEDPESEYLKAMTGDVTFDLLVNWVYDYQINSKQYTKDEIRKVYTELLKYLYEINVKPIVQKGKALSY